MRTVGEPVTHGAIVTGTQGIGVSTPIAAAVAAMTVGFDGLEHMPNGGTLTIGAKSMMVAAGAPVSVRLTGKTANAAGAAPKLHCIIAPAHTWQPIESLSPQWRHYFSKGFFQSSHLSRWSVGLPTVPSRISSGSDASTKG
jgi:hypothetical protein